MTHIITGEVFCPLCEQPMTRRKVLIYMKEATVYLCRPCTIGVFDFDPAFDKWRDADKDIPCSVCGFEKIKWFARYMDGFFKSFCPRCKTTMKKDGDVKFGGRGNIIIPDDMYEEEIEEPVELRIPYAHLEKKLGKDKINALRNKNRNKKRPK